SFKGVGQPYVLDGTILDGRIYLFYCLIYGGFNQLIYLWLRAMSFQQGISGVVVSLWAIYPGNLAMATLLDSTYLSAFLIAWTIFLQYLYLRDPSVRRLVVFLVVFLIASLTRTLFQIHFGLWTLVTVIFFIFMFHRQDLIKASITVFPV